MIAKCLKSFPIRLIVFSRSTQEPSSCFCDFNAHNAKCLTHSRCTDSRDFAISHNLSQIVTFSSGMPDRDGDSGCFLDFFQLLLSTSASPTISPLGSSDHCAVIVKCKQIFLEPSVPFHRAVYRYSREDGGAPDPSSVKFPKT